MWNMGRYAIANIECNIVLIFFKGLPKSGGEKNYLEFTFHQPQYLMTCIFAAYTSISVSLSTNLLHIDLDHRIEELCG